MSDEMKRRLTEYKRKQARINPAAARPAVDSKIAGLKRPASLSENIQTTIKNKRPSSHVNKDFSAVCIVNKASATAMAKTMTHPASSVADELHEKRIRLLRIRSSDPDFAPPVAHSFEYILAMSEDTIAIRRQNEADLIRKLDALVGRIRPIMENIGSWESAVLKEKNALTRTDIKKLATFITDVSQMRIVGSQLRSDLAMYHYDEFHKFAHSTSELIDRLEDRLRCIQSVNNSILLLQYVQK